MGLPRTVVTLFLLLFILHCCRAKYFIAAPNLLRVGVEETVSVTVFGTGNVINIKLSIQDYPHRKRTFSQVEGNFRKEVPGLLKIKVNPKDLSDQKSLDKQYVYLKASSSSPGFQFNDEIKILVSYRNAMVFIQTDKPIYTPGQTVNLRVIPLNLDLKASLKNVTIEMLNPQGVRVDRWKDLNTQEGFFSRRKILSENSLLGDWTINALYGHGLVQNASVKFEVREYILPKFSVKVEGPPYILDIDNVIGIKVTSKYTYGKGVKGTAQVNLAVLDDAGKTERFSTSFHSLKDGVANVIVNTDVLRRHAKKLWFPDGKRLFVEAKVIEEATGKQEDVVDNTIYFTKSPVKISFKRTTRFFKPGVPFEIKVDVAYMNGKPANGIDIEIDAKTNTDVTLHERRQVGAKANQDTTDHLGHGSFIVDVPKTFSITHLNIKVTAKIKKGQQEINSENSFQPTMYKSQGNNYLFVRIPKSQVGQYVDAEAFVLSMGKPTSLTYLAVARGRVVAQGTIVRNLGVVTSIRFRVTSDMSPQARLVVYYIVGNEVVVDSAIMEVDETYPNQISFVGNNNPKLPGEPHTIEIQTNPHSHVGILAVDQSVYLLRNDKHLTDDTVFRRIKSHDLGCGSGAGQNNKDVLSRAGLAVMTNSNLKTDTRTDQRCSAAARRKRRSVNLPHQEKCCTMGEIADPRSCFVRSKEFSKNVSASLHPIESCVVRYYRCCKNKFGSGFRSRAGNDQIPPDLLNEIDLDQDEELLQEILEDVQVRTNFPETWLYEDEKAGKNGVVKFFVTVPDSITTWVMQAVSVSNITGFGLTPPRSLIAFKPFFVSLSLPYSAQRGEQVSVVATIFNYNNDISPQKIKLLLYGTKEFCSHVDPIKRKIFYELTVNANDVKSISFPIVPTTLGEISVQIYAVSILLSDSEQRILKVLPEGMQRRKTYTVTLDPQDILRDPNAPKPVKPTTPSKILTASKGNGKQTNLLDLVFPNSTVPDSDFATLSVIGNLIGPVVTNVIEGRGLDSIIKMPTGCGEQTMLRLAPNVFVLEYLRSTKQVTPQIETTAFNFIRSGYQNELNYRRSDNSFSAFGNTRPGSTWLTAFVIKTFCAIQKLDGIEIDQNVICSAINWLSSIQRADGAIPESNPVIHQEMNGDINGEIAMTAYVVTALLECKCNTQNTVQTIKNAVAFLENNRNKIGRVYVKAVVAYALALASSPQRDAANNELLAAAQYDADKNVRYWTDGGNAINVETTSYALLTQMVLKRVGYSGPIVVWLTEQRQGGGGFVSTQDTCVALQALAAYSQATGGNLLDLTVVITSEMDANYKYTLRINKKNALVQQQLDISALIGGELYVETKGSGVAQLQVETIYNTPPTEVEVCQFDLTVTTMEEVKKLKDQPIVVGKPKKSGTGKGNSRTRRGRGRGKRRGRGRRGRGRGRGRGRRGGRRGGGGRRSGPQQPKPNPTNVPRIQRDLPVTNSISLKICTRYKKAGEIAGMSIIDVGILTGFSVDLKSLNDLKDNVKPGIAKYEISDRHVVLYVDNIPSSHTLCFPLKMVRDFEVGLVQSVPVTVYDYYEPDNKCTEYYGPQKNSQLRLATCDENHCRCLLSKCTSCNPPNDAPTVVKKFCNVYDYAIRGKVVSIDEKNTWLYIKIKVRKIMKFGSRNLAKNQILIFQKQAVCDCPAIDANTIDAEYLIMGKNEGARSGGMINLNSEVFVKKWSNAGAKFYVDFLKSLSEKDPCANY